MKHTPQDIAYFLSFCIEKYKEQEHISGAEAMNRLAQWGVLLYLAENFEVLHTQSAQWILEDINEFIQIRRDNAPC